MTKNYLLKIPKNISIFYSEKYQSILIKGPISQKIIKLKTKIKVKKKIIRYILKILFLDLILLKI